MPTSELLSADDPANIQLLKPPEIGPPFDDDLAAGAIEGTVVSVPGAVAGEANPARGLAGSATAHAVKGPAAQVGPDGDWARQFARLLTEALSGARPVRQILPCTSERARVQLRALIPLFAGGQRPRLLRVIATRPARDVIEMTVIAGLGARTRALAIRLQRAEPTERPGWLSPAGASEPRQASAAPRWLCTDIEAA